MTKPMPPPSAKLPDAFRLDSEPGADEEPAR